MLRQETDRLAPDADFDVFYREQYARLVRALILLAGPSDAEDLAQEALSRVFERWERVSGMESPEGYLYRTALNVHRTVWRRRRRRSDTDAVSEVSTDAVDERLTILAAVSTLPRKQREALVLVEWLGFGAREAGAILGIEAVSVRSRLMDARNRLRPLLGGFDD
jgi:RNA polymerase sigma factor (sigma-70 family)